ncbi:MAG TPA: hypothetical protein VFU88_04845, partial [Ktedonobacterales bacterium]|nr:hypothetical protein [Ktedonobacterales bacterium]
LESEAAAVERAVRDAIAAGYRTADIAGAGKGGRLVSTGEMGAAVVERIPQADKTAPARGIRERAVPAR